MFKVKVLNYVQGMTYISYLDQEELECFHNLITRLDNVTHIKLQLKDNRTVVLPKLFLENSVFYYEEIKEGD